MLLQNVFQFGRLRQFKGGGIGRFIFGPPGPGTEIVHTLSMGNLIKPGRQLALVTQGMALAVGAQKGLLDDVVRRPGVPDSLCMTANRRK